MKTLTTVVAVLMLVASLSAQEEPRKRTFQGLADVIGAIPPKLVSKPVAKETQADHQDRASWFKEKVVGQNLKVAGEVISVSTDNKGAVILTVRVAESRGRLDFKALIILTMLSDQAAKAKKAGKGDRVEVSGTVSGFKAMRSAKTTGEVVWAIDATANGGRVHDVRPGPKKK